MVIEFKIRFKTQNFSCLFSKTSIVVAADESIVSWGPSPTNGELVSNEIGLIIFSLNIFSVHSTICRARPHFPPSLPLSLLPSLHPSLPSSLLPSISPSIPSSLPFHLSFSIHLSTLAFPHFHSSICHSSLMICFIYCLCCCQGYGLKKGGSKSSTNPKIVEPLEGIYIHTVTCGLGHTLFIARDDSSEDKENIKKLPVYEPSGP